MFRYSEGMKAFLFLGEKVPNLIVYAVTERQAVLKVLKDMEEHGIEDADTNLIYCWYNIQEGSIVC